MFLISDNIDTLMGFRLVGVEGVVVHSPEEVVSHLSKVLNESNIALVMINEKIVRSCYDIVYSFKFSGYTQIVQIPDRHGGGKSASETIREYLKSALGVSI